MAPNGCCSSGELHQISGKHLGLLLPCDGYTSLRSLSTGSTYKQRQPRLSLYIPLPCVYPGGSIHFGRQHVYTALLLCSPPNLLWHQSGIMQSHSLLLWGSLGWGVAQGDWRALLGEAMTYVALTEMDAGRSAAAVPVTLPLASTLVPLTTTPPRPAPFTHNHHRRPPSLHGMRDTLPLQWPCQWHRENLISAASPARTQLPKPLQQSRDQLNCIGGYWQKRQDPTAITAFGASSRQCHRQLIVADSQLQQWPSLQSTLSIDSKANPGYRLWTPLPRVYN